MTPEGYIERAKDPRSWFDESRRLLEDQELLYDRFIEHTRNLVDDDYSSDEDREHAARRAGSLVSTIELLLGLSLENALKGDLMSENPGDFEIEVSVDGRGDFTGAKLRKIGGSTIDHDLKGLGHEANLFNMETNPVLTEPSDIQDMEAMFEHLTHAVRWRGRYPVPKDTSEYSEWSDNLMTSGGQKKSAEPPIVFSRLVAYQKMARDLVSHLLPSDMSVQAPVEPRERN